MGLTDSQTTQMILGLFPKGLAWAKSTDSIFYKFAQALTDEAQRLQNRGYNLLEERDPRTTFELLPDWERVAGLPDACSPASPTLTQRRNAVALKITSFGAINRQFYIDLAAKLGFQISILEYRPFYAGFAKAGDPISNGNWIYAWTVVAPADTRKSFIAGGSSAGDLLKYVANGPLECAISARKPAHTLVLFSYTA